MKDIYVVKVIDDYRVVLNAGSDDEISLGQKFLIYSVSAEPLYDPKTNESLGYLEIVKGTGKVTHVQEKICTIESCIYHKNSTKILRKPVFAYLGETIEECCDAPVQEPFDNPEVNDKAKPL